MFPPAYNSMVGRAEALAASLGDGPISPEHVLMALIWDPSSLSSQLLWRRGSGGKISSRAPLTRRGRPTHVDPASGRGRNGERIWIDREEVQRVITELPKRLVPATHFGFNYEDNTAWVVAEASVDLRSLVDDVLAS
jgi:hypothetical protein